MHLTYLVFAALGKHRALDGPPLCRIDRARRPTTSSQISRSGFPLDISSEQRRAEGRESLSTII